MAVRMTPQRITVLTSRRAKIFALEGGGGWTGVSDIGGSLADAGEVANLQLPCGRVPVLALDARFVNWTAAGLCPRFPPVPNPSKTAAQNPAAKPGLSFEEALKKLEAIVEAMEADDLPLETLLARYEEGTQLARLCQEKLAEAELKIAQLEKIAGGELKLKPLSAELAED